MRRSGHIGGGDRRRMPGYTQRPLTPIRTGAIIRRMVIVDDIGACGRNTDTRAAHPRMQLCAQMATPTGLDAAPQPDSAGCGLAGRAAAARRNCGYRRSVQPQRCAPGGRGTATAAGAPDAGASSSPGDADTARATARARASAAPGRRALARRRDGASTAAPQPPNGGTGRGRRYRGGSWTICSPYRRAAATHDAVPRPPGKANSTALPAAAAAAHISALRRGPALRP